MIINITVNGRLTRRPGSSPDAVRDPYDPILKLIRQMLGAFTEFKKRRPTAWRGSVPEVGSADAHASPVRSDGAMTIAARPEFGSLLTGVSCSAASHSSVVVWRPSLSTAVMITNALH